MSHKNLITPKNKWYEETKTTNSGIFKEPIKVSSQYPSKNVAPYNGHSNKQVHKNIKNTGISRHASQQQFKKQYIPYGSNNQYSNSYQSSYKTNQDFANRPSFFNSIEDQQPLSPSINHSKSLNDYNRLAEQQYTKRIHLYTNNYGAPPNSSNSHTPYISPYTSNLVPNNRSPKLKIKEKQKNDTNQQCKIAASKLNKNMFVFLKKIGQGKFGKVFMVREMCSGFLMAMKIQDKKKIIKHQILQQFVRQLKIQAFLNHSNIIDIYGFFDDDEFFYTLQELGSDGQLYDIISQHRILTEETTSFIIKNLLEAVNWMHQLKILHRDIKPENIVLTMGNVKLCDFGWAAHKAKKQQLRSTFCGTPLYLSPEILKGYKYDEKVDIWAIGILTYELLVGCSPFEINEHQDLYKILNEDVQFPKTKKISIQFQDFIKNILSKNPKDRLPSDQLLTMTFIKKYQDLETCQELCT